MTLFCTSSIWGKNVSTVWTLGKKIHANTVIYLSQRIIKLEQYTALKTMPTTDFSQSPYKLYRTTFFLFTQAHDMFFLLQEKIRTRFWYHISQWIQVGHAVPHLWGPHLHFQTLPLASICLGRFQRWHYYMLYFLFLSSTPQKTSEKEKALP